jgi:hypothetical protein
MIIECQNKQKAKQQDKDLSQTEGKRHE